MSNKVEFIRKCTPDGGVEACCHLDNFDEFIKFLKEKNLSIVWIFWYEKDIYSDDKGSFKKLETNDFYYLQDGEIKGSYIIV